MSTQAKGRVRVDMLLVERGLAPSREKAQALVLAGEVFRGTERIDKPGSLVDPNDAIDVSARRRFVSRGGDKLDGALGDLGFTNERLAGRVAIDIGASTGGFTDCLLQRGVARIYAVDVGKNQLDARLRSDPRVVVHEGTNARSLERDTLRLPDGAVDDAIDLIVVDASFIGLGALMPAIARLLLRGDLIALVKPQFEAGKKHVAKGRGVIRDPEVRASAIDGAREAITREGLVVVAEADSRLKGPKGNLERFIHARI